MNTKSLFQLHPTAKTAQLRLVCFPYAGGNPDRFLRWLPHLLPGVDLAVCHLPGRGARITEMPYDDMNPLITAMERELASLAELPLVVFGHSLGAKLAYEFALALHRHGLAPPLHMVVSAATPPFSIRCGRLLHTLSDAQFVDALSKLGGTPLPVLRNKEFLAMYLPALRADYKLVETYSNTSMQPIRCPVTLFGGRDDPYVNALQLEQWGVLFDRIAGRHCFDSGHFFIDDTSHALLAYLNENVLRPGLPAVDSSDPFQDIAL